MLVAAQLVKLTGVPEAKTSPQGIGINIMANTNAAKKSVENNDEPVIMQVVKNNAEETA
jgi:hypothetical protein